MAASPYPLPPSIRQQQQPQSPFAMAPQGGGQEDGGPGGAQQLQPVMQQLQKLEQWLTETLNILNTSHPPMKALLAPIAQAGKAMQAQTMELAQRSGMQRGSPVVPPTPPANPAEGPRAGAMVG